MGLKLLSPEKLAYKVDVWLVSGNRILEVIKVVNCAQPVWANHMFCAEDVIRVLPWSMPGRVLPVGPAPSKNLGRLGFSG